MKLFTIISGRSVFLGSLLLAIKISNETKWVSWNRYSTKKEKINDTSLIEALLWFLETLIMVWIVEQCSTKDTEEPLGSDHITKAGYDGYTVDLQKPLRNMSENNWTLNSTSSNLTKSLLCRHSFG